MDPAVWFQEDMIMDCKLRAKNLRRLPDDWPPNTPSQLKKKEADVRALLGKYGPSPHPGDGNALPLP